MRDGTRVPIDRRGHLEYVRAVRLLLGDRPWMASLCRSRSDGSMMAPLPVVGSLEAAPDWVPPGIWEDAFPHPN